MRVLIWLAALLANSPAIATESLRVGVVVFEGFLSAEVVGLLEVFTRASSEGPPSFEVLTVARAASRCEATRASWCNRA